VEDWEQFFAEKSHRRAEKERAERRRRRNARVLITVTLGLGILAGIAGLAALR